MSIYRARFLTVMNDVSKLIYAKYGKDYSEVTKRTASRFQNASRICIQNVVEVQSVQIHSTYLRIFSYK